AFASHGGKRFGRFRQNHDQGIEKGAQNSSLLPIIPRKSRPGRDGRRRGNRTGAGELRLWTGRTAGPGFLRKFGNLRKGLPGCHSFAPAKIRANEFSAAESFPHFIFRKCPQISTAAVDMKSSHSEIGRASCSERV